MSMCSLAIRTVFARKGAQRTGEAIQGSAGPAGQAGGRRRVWVATSSLRPPIYSEDPSNCAGPAGQAGGRRRVWAGGRGQGGICAVRRQEFKDQSNGIF